MIMKRIVLSIIAVLLPLAAFSQSGKSIYNKYSDCEGVNALYISPAMFKMMGSLPELEDIEEDVDMTQLVKSLDAMYILECENPTVSSSLEQDVREMVSSGKYELMMEVKEDGERMNIYTVKKGSQIESFVFLCSENTGSLSCIVIDGRISETELNKLISTVAD